MKFFGKFVRKQYDEDGNMEITFRVNSLRDKETLREISKEPYYRIALTEAKSKRTLQQNRYMWELIHEIAEARNGGRAENDDWEVYIEALERAGAKYDYIACLPQADEALRSQFRAIKLMNTFIHNGKEFNQYKVYFGSSKMDKTEMGLLLETVLDMAEELNIPTGGYFGERE